MHNIQINILYKCWQIVCDKNNENRVNINIIEEPV